MVRGDAEGRELRAGDGARVVLGELIKSGGAGSVYRVREQPEVVAKLYHDSVDHPVYARKVEAMLQLTPQLPELSEGGRRYVQIAWPRTLLRDPRGRFVGYLMPAVDVKATSELECVLQEKQARSLGLPTGLGAKVTLAANLASVLAELHRQQHRIVDLKPVNLRFYPSSLYMAVLDCDGFSIQGHGERFEAPQFTPDYLAPEFQRGGLSAPGEEAQDRFALAVIVFQLLNFGIHPFTGRPTHDGVPTDIPGRIAARLYAYGQRGNARLLPSPVSGHESMPAELRALFDRAFDGAGAARPSALEWGTALRGYAQRSSLRLAHCTREREHQHFAGLPCASCARSALLAKTAKASGTSLPPAHPAAGGAPRATRGTGRGGFHWSRPKRAVATKKGKRVKGAPLPSWTVPGPLPTLRPVRPGARRPPPPPPSSNLSGAMTLGLVFGPMVVVVLAVLFALAMRQLNGPSAPSTSSFERSTVPEPLPLRQPPEALDITPIAEHEPGTLVLPSFRQIQDTRTKAQWVADATAGDNQPVVGQVMGELRLSPRNQLPERKLARQQLQAQFRVFAEVALELPASQRVQYLQGIAQLLGSAPYDAEAACEWSWLALQQDHRELAFDGFVRAIWADPDYSCGWFGFGVLSDDPRIAYGALMVAEGQQFDDPGFIQTRDGLVEAALAASPAEVERWQILDARARERVAVSRQQEVPAEITERARKPLPGSLP